MSVEIPEKTRSRAAAISLTAAILICAIKFGGYFLTDSAAILSDALESVNNILSAIFVVYSLRLSARAADQDFFYGRGRIEYFSAGFEGGLILLAGLVILYESLPRLWLGAALHTLEQGIGLVVLASALNGVLGWYLIRTGRRLHSAALVADGKHVMSDLVTSVAVLFALGLVYLTELTWLDPLVACLVGVWLLWNGFGVMRSSFDHLMDRVAPELFEQVTAALGRARRPDMIYPHRLRLREMGHRLLLDLHCFVPRFYTVDQIHDLETSFAADVQGALGRELDFMMHLDPCRPVHCMLCGVPGCPVRQSQQSHQVAWSAEGLVSEPGEAHGREFEGIRAL